MGSFGRDRRGRRDSKPGFRDGSSRDSESRRDFKPRDSGRFRDSDDRQTFRKELEMHTAVCDRCGKRCEVPFRPSWSKPVYCSDCFRKGENFESKSPDQNKKEFDIINEKLDRILEALGK